MKQQVNIKKLDDRAIIPTYGTAFSAGADLYACMDHAVTIAPGETYLVHTGISAAIPEGYAGLIYARSGLATKKGLAPANKVGVIDVDKNLDQMKQHANLKLGEMQKTVDSHFTGQYNTMTNKWKWAGERIAQMVITPFLTAEFVETAELDETERGAGGFGSTGRI